MSDKAGDDAKSPDWEQGSPEDKATDAPTGKEGVSEQDEDLEPDQLAIQSDSS